MSSCKPIFVVKEWSRVYVDIIKMGKKYNITNSTVSDFRSTEQNVLSTNTSVGEIIFKSRPALSNRNTNHSLHKPQKRHAVQQTPALSATLVPIIPTAKRQTTNRSTKRA